MNQSTAVLPPRARPLALPFLALFLAGGALLAGCGARTPFGENLTPWGLGGVGGEGGQGGAAAQSGTTLHGGSAGSGAGQGGQGGAHAGTKNHGGAGQGGVGGGGVGGAIGPGGAGAAAGDGGGPAGAAGCEPGQGQTCDCGGGPPGVQTCGPEGCVCPGTDEFQLLKWYQAAVVGQWKGTVLTPWVDEYPVDFRFDADGHYAAHALSSSEAALYWGTDADSPLKTYELNDVLASKEAEGVLKIVFDGASTNQGYIKQLGLSDGLMTLNFEVWKGEYGPLRYKLQRVVGP